MASGRLMMMPSAPWALCSQTSVTVCEKFGSLMRGMATRNWLVRKSPDMAASILPGCARSQALRGAEAGVQGAPVRTVPAPGRPDMNCHS